MRYTIRAVGIAVSILAGGVLLAGCGSSRGTPDLAAASSASASPSASPAADATAPAAGECTSFAQVYNGQVGPLLTAGANGGNVDVYFTKLGDAFQALDATVSSGADPYSQTIVKDGQTLVADPSSYTALTTFNTDLATFLKSCGMTGSTS